VGPRRRSARGRPPPGRTRLGGSVQPEEVSQVGRNTQGVTLIRLNRPEALNALNTQLLGELSQALDAAESDETVRCVVLTGSEKAFSLGRFDIDYLDRSPIAVARENGRIVAFANLLVGTGGREAMIDLMRHDPDGPHGIMDYLFTRTAQWAREQGMERLDLGMAPLSGLEDRRMAPVFARVGALVFEEGGAVYGFQGLRSYKAKFAPRWTPRFIAAPASTPLPLALLDVALLTSGGWLGMLGLRKG
jgi:lysylphosphatidylglycerol synthetase-like protein (DUF2156 family)